MPYNDDPFDESLDECLFDPGKYLTKQLDSGAQIHLTVKICAYNGGVPKIDIKRRHSEQQKPLPLRRLTLREGQEVAKMIILCLDYYRVNLASKTVEITPPVAAPAPPIDQGFHPSPTAPLATPQATVEDMPAAEGSGQAALDDDIPF